MQAFVFIIFRIPLDRIVEADGKPVNTKLDLPIELYPQVIQHSKSKTVLFDDKKGLARIHEEPPLPSSKPKRKLFSTFVKWLFRSIISLSSIRFLLNFISVFVRLVILYYSVKLCVYFPCWCIRYIFNLEPISFVFGQLFLLYLKSYIALYNLRY